MKWPVISPDVGACVDCRFFRHAHRDDSQGTCFRFPPSTEHEWPTVDFLDGCGEFVRHPDLKGEASRVGQDGRPKEPTPSTDGPPRTHRQGKDG